LRMHGRATLSAPRTTASASTMLVMFCGFCGSFGGVIHRSAPRHGGPDKSRSPLCSHRRFAVVD
jgi:hypothetical protein